MIGLTHLRFVSGISAYIDKLAEDEAELQADLERLNADRTEKLTQEQLLSDRGVGLRAFEWRAPTKKSRLRVLAR